MDPEQMRVFDSVTHDVAMRGLYIETDDPAPTGTILEVDFLVPEFPEPIRALALVRWSKADGDPPGMGVSLQPLDTESQNAWNAFIAAATQEEKNKS
jgi:uncharacterized protein (TIGR02266 family)